MTNISLTNNFFNWIEKKSERPGYVHYLAIVLVSLSLFFATPKYLFYLHNPGLVAETWNTYVLKSKNLLDPLTSVNPYSHQGKLVFRLTVPVLIKIFGFNYAGAYCLKFIVGILLLIQLYRLSKKLLNDSVAATFLTSGLTFLYFGRACFVAYPTFDGIAFYCTVLALSYRQPILIFLLSTIASWIDERAFVSLPIILLFHQLGTEKKSDFEWRNLIKLNSSGVAVIAAIAGYVALRCFLSFQFRMYTPTSDINSSLFSSNAHLMGFGIWTFFEGFWLLFLFAILYAVTNRHYLFLSAILTQTFVSGLIACSVGDVSRSGAYLVPLVFVFAAFLKSLLSGSEMKFILFICAVFSFLFPAYYMITKSVDMQHPIYYDGIAFVLNKLM